AGLTNTSGTGTEPGAGGLGEVAAGAGVDCSLSDFGASAAGGGVDDDSSARPSMGMSTVAMRTTARGHGGRSSRTRARAEGEIVVVLTEPGVALNTRSRLQHRWRTMTRSEIAARGARVEKAECDDSRRTSVRRAWPADQLARGRLSRKWKCL